MPYDFGGRDKLGSLESFGSKEPLGAREAERDIQSLRRRKGKVGKKKNRGFLSGIKESKGSKGKGLGYVPKSRGGLKFGADMVGVKEKTWKMGSII